MILNCLTMWLNVAQSITPGFRGMSHSQVLLIRSVVRLQPSEPLIRATL